MPTTDTAEQLPEVNQPKHPMYALTTYELRDHRRELERAVAFYDKYHPAAPVLADLRTRLDDVLAEQESRARITANA
jgi:hypothetical protein